VAIWAVVIGPVLSAPGGAQLVREYGLTYPIADVAVLTVVVLVAARASGRWLRQVLLVAAALTVVVATDFVFVALVLRGRYSTGGLLDLGWVIGFLLIATAALLPPAASDPRVESAIRAPRARILLPYLPVAVALIAPAVAGPGLKGSGLVAGGLAVVLLLLARQALSAVENAELAADLSWLAYSDSLTGLANRTLFAEWVAHAQRRVRRGGRLSVLLLDLDGFKAVNDSLGHAAGDRLLVLLAERLRGAVEPGDLVARLGGDEFAVLVEAAGPGAGLRTARRVLDALSAPVPFEGRVVRVTASIGVVEQAEQSPDDVLRDADVAMYAAKTAGKACVREFEPAMRRAVVAKAELEADLRHALDRGEFVVQYQPTVDLNTREVTGAEALVRWRHPRRGMLTPSAFLPLAEETGLIADVDAWVLDAACAAAAGWQDLRPGFTVSVNVAADRFARTDLVGAVADALADTGLPPSCLTLELTETALVADAEATISRLSALDALGVQVAIDDFGTGYSSLAYLHRLPASVLKIDKSFVEGLGTNAESTALVRVILGLAETFGLRTVAEGVETESQRALLRALGCVTGQGYLFAPALDPDELEAMLGGPARGVGRARLRALDPVGPAASPDATGASGAAGAAALEPAELPVEVPVEVPAEVPVEVPAEVPVEVPVDVPVEVPVAAAEPGEEPAARGVGPARLRPPEPA
jgi:diguanylate cyclase (GGDEF)-like protein